MISDVVLNSRRRFIDVLEVIDFLETPRGSASSSSFQDNPFRSHFPSKRDGNEPQSEFFIYAEIVLCNSKREREEKTKENINFATIRRSKPKLRSFDDEKWNNKLLRE
jgi:hypothetical protein